MRTRVFHRLKFVLRLGVFSFIIVSVYNVSFQSSPKANRCQGDSTESCLIEEDRRSFEHLIVKKKPTNKVHAKDLDEKIARDSRLLLPRSQDSEDYDENLNDTNQEKNLKAIPLIDVDNDLDETEGNGDVIQKEIEQSNGNQSKKLKVIISKENTSSIRLFPPLYSTVLPNGLNCSKVWNGDEHEVSRAQTKLNDTKAARRPPGFYESIAENCDLYRQQNGYLSTVSNEEKDFPLAFSVVVYKDVEQLERLLRAVYRPHNVYCLHPDLKTQPQVLQQIRAIIKCVPNVIEASRRIDVVWGKFSVLEPELICMETLWRMRSKWRYFINLTGQEFPIKTNRELVKILQSYRGANDILGEIPKERNKWRWEKAGSPPHNISIGKGPVHVAASRGFVDFLLHSKYARDFLNWTRSTAIPDETFFATLNNLHWLGVPGSYAGNLTSRRRIMLNRYKIWDVAKKPCSGKFVRHICHFGLREVAVLATSRHMIANKFTYDFYPLAFDCLEQWYFHKVEREERTNVVAVDTRYYSNLEIVKYAFREENKDLHR